VAFGLLALLLLAVGLGRLLGPPAAAAPQRGGESGLAAK
jgi:hypothetical protein